MKLYDPQRANFDFLQSISTSVMRGTKGEVGGKKLNGSGFGGDFGTVTITINQKVYRLSASSSSSQN